VHAALTLSIEFFCSESDRSESIKNRVTALSTILFDSNAQRIIIEHSQPLRVGNEDLFANFALHDDDDAFKSHLCELSGEVLIIWSGNAATGTLNRLKKRLG
jgi:hypothetical protein